MQLYEHQKKFVSGYKDKCIIAHECGTGKTVCACMWLKDNRDSDALIICPKRVIQKWEAELVRWGTKGTVVSKEQFKKIKLRKWSSVVVDEFDDFLSPLFTKGRSQLSASLYELIKKYPETPIMLASATVIRSNPWNLHTALTFSGNYIDWKEWREYFFLILKMPYLPYPAWLPKKNWRKQMRPILEKYADIVLLSDCVDELPPITERIIDEPAPKFTINEEWTPKAAFVEEHNHEQKNKIKTILEIGKEYRKVLVVAYYVEQVEELNRQLSKDRETFMVHGSTKKQEETLKYANEEVDECFVVIQASVTAGFDADTFSCIIFTSMSYSVRDWIQVKGRVRRIHNLRPVEHVYILSGRCDKAVLKQVRLGKDFSPSEWQIYEPS